MTTTNSANTYIVPTVANEVTMPAQPAFLAYNSATDLNQTGNGATVTVQFDTEVFDQNADYNNGTYTFTAPVTGVYLLISYVTINDLDVNATTFNIQLNTSNRNYNQTCGNNRDTNDAQGIMVSSLCDMDAADTSTVSVTVSGMGGNTADIVGDTPSDITGFSGILIT